MRSPVRLKVYSERGKNRIVVVDEEGWERDLLGVTSASFCIKSDQVAELTLTACDFVPPEIKGLR